MKKNEAYITVLFVWIKNTFTHEAMLNDMLKTLGVLLKWVGIKKLKKRGETHHSLLKELKKLFAMNQVVQCTQSGYLRSNEKTCMRCRIAFL